MATMRQRIDQLKQEATNVENDSSKLKQRIVAEVAAMSGNSAQQSGSARLIEQQYRNQQKASEDHAKSLKDTVATIEKHLSEVVSVHTELKKHETYMRDMELTVTNWANRAQELMNRSSL